jgi:hypothetical protein
MSNCDDLLQQIQALKDEVRKLSKGADDTERISRAIAGIEESGDPPSRLLQRLLQTIDSEGTQSRVRRGLGARETPMGADGQFTNFKQLADWLDQATAQEVGAFHQAMTGDWQKLAPEDFAFVTKRQTPESVAEIAVTAMRDYDLDRDALVEAFKLDMATVSRIFEVTTRNHVLADIGKQNMLAAIRSIRAFVEEAGVPATPDLVQHFIANYDKALFGHRNWAHNRRELGRALQSTQGNPAKAAEQLRLSEQDILVRPGTENSRIPEFDPPETPGADPRLKDYTDDTIAGKVLKLIGDGPDGVEGLKQLEISIQVDGMNPLGELDTGWASPAARRDAGYLKDAWLFNTNTPIFSSYIPNRVMELYGALNTAVENGPLGSASFATKGLKSYMADRFNGWQTAWEAWSTTQRGARFLFKEMYWEKFFDGDTPFANDVTMHGRQLSSEAEMQEAMDTLRRPINWNTNPLGDEGVVRDMRDKLFVSYKLVQKSLMEKIPGIENFPVKPGFRMLSTDDNSVGVRMYRFKLYNDILLDARKNGIQLGLADAATGVADEARLKAYVDQKVDDAIYKDVPSEQNLVDFRRQHNITADLVDDEDLRAYMINAKVGGHPVLVDGFQQSAWDYAEKMRMQNKPEGALAKPMYDFMKYAGRQNWTLDSTIGAFPKIPANSFQFLLDTAISPLKTVYLGAKLAYDLHGGRATAKQIAEAEASLVLTGFLAGSFLALNNDVGKLTGNGPPPGPAREQWLARMKQEGRLPNSVFGLPLPVGQIPLLNTLLLWKDVLDALDAAGASDQDRRDATGALLQVGAGALIRQTPLAFLQNMMRALSDGSDQGWQRFTGWMANGQLNPMSGITNSIQRLTGSGASNYYRYPQINEPLPEGLQLTQDNLKNLLVQLVPLSGRIMGIPTRDKDRFGRDIYLSPVMRQGDLPPGMPGFWTSPVYRELEKQGLLSPTAELMKGYLNNTPLSPDGQKEFIEILGTIKGGNDYYDLMEMKGKAADYTIKEVVEVFERTPSGDIARLRDVTVIDTFLADLVAKAVNGRTNYEAQNWLINSPEYKQLQAEPATTSNPEVRDLPPVKRRTRPGPMLIEKIDTYFYQRAIDRFETQTTPAAMEWKAIQSNRYKNNIPDTTAELNSVNKVQNGLLTPAR